MTNITGIKATTVITDELANTIPAVFIKDGEVFASSRDVAEFFGKAHFNVMNDIRGILKSQDTPSDWFQMAPFRNEQNGMTYQSFDMTRDGFTLLVMGYTGPKAMAFKVRYIQAFNEMEAKLKEQVPQAPALPDFSNPAEAARAWADQYERRTLLEAKVEEDAPKVDAFHRLMDAEGCITSTDLAKIINLRSAQAVHKVLHEAGVIFPMKDRMGRTLGWRVRAAYSELGWHRTTTNEHNGRTIVATKWTTKGVDALSKIILERVEREAS